MSMETKTYQQERWSLSDLFPAPNSPELEAAFKKLDQAVTEFESFRPQLTPDIVDSAFMGIVHKFEAIQDLGSRLYGFAGLFYTEDTQNQAAQSLTARVEQFVADLTNRTLFFTLWWRDLDDVNAARLTAASGGLQYWLEALRAFKPHTLTEPEEKIVNIKNVTGASAVNLLYSSITNRYTFKDHQPLHF